MFDIKIIKYLFLFLITKQYKSLLLKMAFIKIFDGLNCKFYLRIPNKYLNL
jgi:hypothetical protein